MFEGLKEARVLSELKTFLEKPWTCAQLKKIKLTSSSYEQSDYNVSTGLLALKCQVEEVRKREPGGLER